jgi:IS1 family transposase
MSVTSQETQVRIISALTEGCSIRATERLTGAHRDTVMRLGVRVGEGCARLHDRLMRNLQVNVVECDEQWDYIAKKQKRVKQGDPAEFGDVWLHVAISATHKAVISYVVGKRDQAFTDQLAFDLRSRILNRPQISADGYANYVGAIRSAFGTDVDFAVITKKYGGDSNLPDAAHRYSPGHVTGVERTVIRGFPKRENISTSYVERFNLSTRMASRRFTRLSNGYSKRLTNHQAAVSLWIAFYNLCRVHETLRCTPAMALGVTDHIWTIGELIAAALEPSDTPPLPRPTHDLTLRPEPPRMRLIVGRGGKGTNKPR